ncbi:DUF397 domain-containing protein [Streptomyces sp. NPDC102270]|uniref:DUF397 domain-containing protein n=1 Tax=Streptomyces sp. NPDC102270 TaxID=3366150 RepID=UPI0038187BF9
MTATSTHQWFKSSYSGGSGTECVEATHVGSDALVRDSKQADSPIVTFTGHAWQAFIQGLNRRAFRT